MAKKKYEDIKDESKEAVVKMKDYKKQVQNYQRQYNDIDIGTLHQKI